MLAVSAMGFAQEDRPAKPAKPAESGMENKASAKRAIGQVTSVDVKTGKLALKTAEQDLSLNVQASAAKESLESIKIGDNVSVSYRDQGGMLVADAITKSGQRTGESAASRSDKAD
jgi:Cu/Ag efflux protein CusF